MEILLTIGWTAFFCYLVYLIPFFRVPGYKRLTLPVMFVIKVLAAVVLTSIYTQYYGNRIDSDIFKYYDDGEVLFSALEDDPVLYLKLVTGIDGNDPQLNPYYAGTNFWYKEFDYGLFNENRTMIRFNAIVRLFSFGSVHVHNVFMAFLSLIGLCGIFKIFSTRFKGHKLVLLAAVFLVPSVLLWTSGVLKEGMVMFSMGLLFYALFRIREKHGLTVNIPLALIMAGLLFFTKIYVFISIIPAFLMIVFPESLNAWKRWTAFFLLHIVLLVAAFNFHHVFPEYNLPEILSTKQNDFINMLDLQENVGSRIEMTRLKPEFSSIAEQVPFAMYNSFCRPHVFEMHNMMAIPAALENLGILILLVLSLIFVRRKWPDANSLLMFSLSFVLVLFIICGLTTPVLGALVRYKTPALPFLVLFLVMIADTERMSRFFRKMIRK
jgi:hypothetical protein